VLEAARSDIAEGTGSAGGARRGWWWLSSFGAGFSCHGALLEVW